ncbi:hypothetical protein ACFO1B_08085 [Dactylosporangium siamense]|uniref:Uncharacterized protein n=1 Tax=Dactylosporangium siamense TaxID=685454 RepID=A0A919UA09_9ACTN|nr:hypothetical protein [Dactylosporangium siamense]GIG48054.1 hypothetical protein Dsi01nite_060950 [Dactylosporangium siamense]
MALVHDASSRAGRRRLHRSVALHGGAVVIFGLMAWRGAGAVTGGLPAMGVPMLLAGAGGATGALVILWSVLRRRDRLSGLHPATRTGAQRAARIGMAVVAVATVTAGVALAPTGSEREFVVWVNVVIGGLLVLFALLAGERAAHRQGEGR